jgi:hypothetical protein
MLRASAKATSTPLDLRGLVNDDVDPLLPGGRQLRAFADAITRRDTAELGAARGRLIAALGDQGTATAAGIVANFEMMNRILDATGVPVPRQRSAILDELGRAGDAA